MIAPALVMLLAEVGPVYVAALSAVPPAEPDRVNELPDDDPATGPLPTGTAGASKRLSNAEAAVVIEKGWRRKLTVREVAEAATRHPATVRAKFKALDTAHTT